MRLTQRKTDDEVRAIVDTALENGINFFDHADIYAGGEAEAAFGKILTPSPGTGGAPDQMCHRPGICFDFSKEHILKSVDDSLKRLNTEYVDLLLLHRPDALMEPEEVAEAFDTLKEQGKVRAFGVSNHNPMQIELLNQAAKGAVKVNQIQFSVAHCPTIDTD